MKRVTFAAALLCLISVPALADTQGVYVSAQGGTARLTDERRADQLNGDEFGTDQGYAISGAVGYALPYHFRVEAEVAYASGFNGALAQSGFIATHRKKFLRGMANVFYDIPTGYALTPYVGGGIGMTRATWKGSATNGVVTQILDGDDDVFTWQLGAGLSYALLDSVSLTLDYRRIQTEDATIAASVAGTNFTQKMNGDAHEYRAGIRWGF